MAFVEDPAPFLADFGDAGTLAGQPVRAIFDGPGGSFLGMTVEAPQVQLPTASVPTQYHNALLVIPQGTFKVREHTPDGTGWSLLTLTAVSA